MMSIQLTYGSIQYLEPYPAWGWGACFTFEGKMSFCYADSRLQEGKPLSTIKGGMNDGQ